MAIIDEFRKQTKETVLEYMDKLALNRVVYSSLVKGFEPYLEERNLLFYIHGTNMVVVCFDLCGKNEELADEGDPIFLDDPEYYSQKGSRVSPVFQLSEALKEMDDRMVNIFPPMDIYGVLLSESTFLNAKDMKGKWDTMRVHVIDGMKGLRHREIATNRRFNEQAKEVMKAIFGDDFRPFDRGIVNEKIEEMNSHSDEFEKLLNEFFNNESKDSSEKHTEEDQDTDPEYSSEESNLEPTEDDTTFNDDTNFPSGEIEQNQNLSVRGEILRPIPNPREELDKLVGCSEIKQRMDELVKLTCYNKMMHELCPTVKQHAVSLHSLFLGRPGTGKTTVCKIYGSLLRQAGALSKGHVVVCDRGTFIGTLWGDEERSVRQVLEMAKGGVLMIDEAYLLNSSNPHDPGKMVIPLLMNILADESQRDIAVVLCGYKEPMQKLIDLNPGLQSRFPNRFEFPDFTIDELLEITKLRIKEYNYTFTTEAWKKYVSILLSAYQTRDPQTWGNARYIGNQLERIYIQHASRCVKQQSNGKSMLFSLTPEDIVPIEVPRPKAKIGF